MTRPTRPARRQALAAMLLMAFGAASAAPTSPPPSPPAANFRLQWRLVPWPPAPVTQPQPGSVTHGTATVASPPPGSTTTRTAPSAPGGPPELLVRNGGQARIAWMQDDVDAAPDWVWSAEMGQGLRGRTRRLSRRDALWVQVQWPGGAAPAQLGFRFEQPQDGARPAAGAQQVEGELLLALDTWQEVGRWAGVGGQGQALQLKLSRLP
jgi:hypothetical protein